MCAQDDGEEENNNVEEVEGTPELGTRQAQPLSVVISEHPCLQSPSQLSSVLALLLQQGRVTNQLIGHSMYDKVSRGRSL